MHVNDGTGQIRRSQKSRKSDQIHPLFEPFGYAASVTRVSGERFRGGILSGLDIIGLPQDHKAAAAGEEGRCWQGNDGFFLHIGSRQVSILSAIGLLLAPAVSQDVTPSSETGEAKEGQSLSSEKEPTVFNLPFPSLNLVLPDSEIGRVPTVIILPGCTVTYRTDGKVFLIKGQDGIKDNSQPLVDLGKGGEWSIDFANRQFALKTADDEDSGKYSSTVTISNDGLRRIISSVDQVLASVEVTSLQSALKERESIKPLPQKQDQPFGVSIDPIIIRLTNSDSKWIEARVNRFHAKLLRGEDGYSRSSIEVGEIVV